MFPLAAVQAMMYDCSGMRFLYAAPISLYHTVLYLIPGLSSSKCAFIDIMVQNIDNFSLGQPLARGCTIHV